MKLQLRIKSISPKTTINSSSLGAMLFILYYACEFWLSLFARTVGTGEYIYIVYNVVFCTLLLLYIFISKGKRLITPLLYYGIITFLFAVTLLFHPEYDEWYFEATYGIQIQFFRATGGIWAFLVICLVDDIKKVNRLLEWTCLCMFLFLTMRYLVARNRGYWIVYGANYEELKLDYDLGFGYSMMSLAVYFAAKAFLERKHIFYIPFALATIMVLLGGSRGAVIWLAAIFPLMIPYRWGAMSKRKRVITTLVCLLLIPVAVLIYVYYDQLLTLLTYTLTSKGISSRTIDALLSGSMTEGNGRERIYEITMERIKEGGLLGNGVFGERVAVGQYYRWGYAHNLFLELYAAFGYLGGTIVSVALIGACIRTGRRCKNTNEQVVFITFLTGSMKLMLSDSFWFNRDFWSLLAIIVIINHRRGAEDRRAAIKRMNRLAVPYQEVIQR